MNAQPNYCVEEGMVRCGQTRRVKQAHDLFPRVGVSQVLVHGSYSNHGYGESVSMASAGRPLSRDVDSKQPWNGPQQ